MDNSIFKDYWENVFQVKTWLCLFSDVFIGHLVQESNNQCNPKILIEANSLLRFIIIQNLADGRTTLPIASKFNERSSLGSSFTIRISGDK